MVVVEDPQTLKAGGPVTVVACSTTIRESETDRIRLPSKADTPICRTGLTKPCWAVPRWFLVVERDRLTDYKGYVGGQKLRELIVAYLKRESEASTPPP